MAKIALTRIDSSLIHGQVATGFIGKSGAGKIIVIDKTAATNEFARDVLDLACPPGVELEVYTAEEAAAQYQEDQFGSGTVLVIIKNIKQAHEAYNKGFKFESIMIGRTGHAPGRVQFEGTISFNEEDALLVDELANAGVKVTIQQTMQTNIHPWADAKRKIPFFK